MKTKIDFRTNKAQRVMLPFDDSKGSLIKFVGICPISKARLYESNNGNDPRGPLGLHCVHSFDAQEYGMTGPSLKVSWINVYQERELHEKALELAKKNWK